jgi:histidine triad (HIT) family protein
MPDQEPLQYGTAPSLKWLHESISPQDPRRWAFVGRLEHMQKLPHGITLHVFDGGNIPLLRDPEFEVIREYRGIMLVRHSGKLFDGETGNFTNQIPICVFCRKFEQMGRQGLSYHFGFDDFITPPSTDIPEVIWFEPLNPVTPGHMLFVPHKHVRNALEDPTTTAKTMLVASAYAKSYYNTSCNFITSVGADASQTVDHLHIHFVPRKPGDGLKLPWTEATKAIVLANAIDRVDTESLASIVSRNRTAEEMVTFVKRLAPDKRYAIRKYLNEQS